MVKKKCHMGLIQRNIEGVKIRSLSEVLNPLQHSYPQKKFRFLGGEANNCSNLPDSRQVTWIPFSFIDIFSTLFFLTIQFNGKKRLYIFSLIRAHGGQWDITNSHQVGLLWKLFKENWCTCQPFSYCLPYDYLIQSSKISQ